MKRFHVHVAVADLGRAISFYSTMFGAEPAVVKDDYAKSDKYWVKDPAGIPGCTPERKAATRCCA